MTRKLLTVLALAISVSASASAAPPATGTGASTVQAAEHQQIFDLVWRTVRDNHYDPKMNGVNWDAVRTKYLPRAKGAKDQGEFYSVLNAMLGELKQSHLGAIPPAITRVTEGINTKSATGGQAGDSGITVEWIENQPVVARVAEKSAGAEAGVKPGYVITAVNGKLLAPILEKILAATPSRYPGEDRVTVWATFEGLLGGTVGTPYTLTVKDENDAEKNVTVTPHKSTAEMVTFGALPPLAAEIETKTLAGGVGYIRFSIFLMPLSDPVKNAIHAFTEKGAPGIIIDLRGNRGGIGVMASGIAGTMTSNAMNLGTMKTRAYTLRFVTNPQRPIYQGRVVVLTDEGSISTSEIMAAGLQEKNRATIIGRQTAGMVLPSQIITLPDGGRLQYVVADFRSPKGVYLEGRGVMPDVPVTLTRQTLAASASGDPILDAALNYLQTAGPRSVTKETVKR